MLENAGYGPSFRRRGRGNMLTHALMAILGAALAAGLLLAFYNPSSGIALPGGGAVPAPGPPSGALTGGEQPAPVRRPAAVTAATGLVTRASPGLEYGWNGSPRC